MANYHPIHDIQKYLVGASMCALSATNLPTGNNLARTLIQDVQASKVKHSQQKEYYQIFPTVRTVKICKKFFQNILLELVCCVASQQPTCQLEPTRLGL